MPRNLTDIINQQVDTKDADNTLSDLDSPSQTAIWSLWVYINAMSQYLLEVLVGTKQTEIETSINSAYVPSEPWLQRKVLEFQYSATNPQIVQLVSFVPTYNPVDTTLKIITRAAVKTTGQRIVTVKVAKQEPPVPLSTPELDALTAYLVQGGDGTVAGSGTGISYAGVQIKVISKPADKLFLKGTIKYNGQYASVVQTNVVAAIDAYLGAIPFDGQVKVLDLIDAIQSISYVTDTMIEGFAIRADGIFFADKTYLIQSFTQLLTIYPTYAGYVVGETTAGETFADRLTFVAA